MRKVATLAVVPASLGLPKKYLIIQVDSSSDPSFLFALGAESNNRSIPLASIILLHTYTRRTGSHRIIPFPRATHREGMFPSEISNRKVKPR